MLFNNSNFTFKLTSKSARKQGNCSPVKSHMNKKPVKIRNDYRVKQIRENILVTQFKNFKKCSLAKAIHYIVDLARVYI